MPVKSPRFALFDLAEGKSYSFRVRCCNSAGVGEPSVCTGETMVGDKLGETSVCIIICFSCDVRPFFSRAGQHDVCSIIISSLYCPAVFFHHLVYAS